MSNSEIQQLIDFNRLNSIIYRRGPRLNGQPAVHRQPGGRGQDRPDGRRQDVAAQVPLQDEVRLERLLQ